jgi:hypothetical protein
MVSPVPTFFLLGKLRFEDLLPYDWEWEKAEVLGVKARQGKARPHHRAGRRLH